MIKKKLKKKVKQPEPAPPKDAPAQEESEDNKFDFGGLPPRDLKKNLGCG